MEVISGKRTIGEITLETRTLYEHLKNLPVGTLVSYRELSVVAGRDVQSEGASSLYTARRMCQREHQIIFGAVYGEGLKRLDDEQIVASADGDIRRIHRTARRGTRKLACADYEALDDAGRASLNAKVAVLGTLAQHSTSASLRKLEKHYANDSPPLLPVSR